MHVLFAGDLLNADDPFMRRLMGEPRWAGQIADGIDAGLAGARKLINHHMAFLDLHFCSLKADILDIADDTHRQNDAIEGVAQGFAGLVLEGGGDGICGFLEFRDWRCRPDGHALFLEELFGYCRSLRMLDAKCADKYS